MAYGVRVRIEGEYALFTRPETKVERYSYDLITHSAARGILDAVYYHPGMRWVIDRVYVEKPIQFTSIRRNEVKSKVNTTNVLSAYNGASKELFLDVSADIAQRASTLLKDVSYVVEAHFELTPQANASDNPGKFQDIATRRLKKGQCYHMPYLGCREFPAKVTWCEEQEIVTAYPDSERDLGLMLYDFDYGKQITPLFFHAVLKNGVLDLTDCEVIR